MPSSPLAALAAKTVEQFMPPASRTGSALCLSGGGYRAALFHLGACRRLNEWGILPNLSVISSVSGGSIFAGHLAKCIKRTNRGCFDDYERLVAVPFRAFAKIDIRTTSALRRLLPWEWAHAGAGARSPCRRVRQTPC